MNHISLTFKIVKMYVFCIIIIFTLTQVFIFNSLPRGIKNYLAYYPLLAVAINIALSSFIMVFAGIAYGFGVVNLGSSLLFGIYVLYYKQKEGLYKSKTVLGFPIIKSSK